MRSGAREALRQRFGFRCGYCGVEEADVGAELTVDHYQPTARGGADDPQNWVYRCFTCNTYKGDLWAPHSPQRILHPLRDDPSQHFGEGPDGRLTGYTETGRFHIEHLHLNRPPLVAYRLERRRREELARALVEAATRQQQLRRRIRELEAAVEEAQQRLRSL